MAQSVEMAKISNLDRDFGTAANMPAMEYSEMERVFDEDDELAAARGIGLGVALGTVAWAGIGLGIWLLVALLRA